jgi:hypothetical protein
MRRDTISKGQSFAVETAASGYLESPGAAIQTLASYRRAAFEFPLLPWPRGPLSELVVSALQREPGSFDSTPPVSDLDPLTDDDFGLALYLCYEVHYRSLSTADWEWDPGMIRFRGELERRFVERLREEIGQLAHLESLEVEDALDELIRANANFSLSLYLSESGTLDQFRELCVHHSVHQLREADPQSFGIPRLTGEAKAALVELQFDDYGYGDPALMHSTLFAETMTALGLDSSYGSYVENLPGVTLARVNLTSMFALQRRWRAALVGHLAVTEMTAVEPMYRYGQTLTRLGVGSKGRRFYEAHAVVDARHAIIARDRLVAGLLGTEPHLEAELLFGAAAALALEEKFEGYLLDAWSQKRSSLFPWELKAV